MIVDIGSKFTKISRVLKQRFEISFDTIWGKIKTEDPIHLRFAERLKKDLSEAIDACHNIDPNIDFAQNLNRFRHDIYGLSTAAIPFQYT